MSELNFNATNVEPDTGVQDPIPAGWYNAMVDQSELKPTRDALGARLACRFNILDGQYVGRKVFTGFNIKNSNPVAQEIAYKQLSALAHAVGVLDVKTSEMLHGIPLKIKVKVKPASGEYEASNEITMYKDSRHNPDGSASASAVPQAGGFSASAPAPVSTPQGFGSVAPVAPSAPQAPVVQAPVSNPKVMTATAQATYEAYIQAGWNDEQLINAGFLIAPVVAVPAVPGPLAPPSQPWENAPTATPSAPTPPSAPLSTPTAPSLAQVATPPWQQ